MIDQAETTTSSPAAAERARPGAPAAMASLRPAPPHDGLLLLAALSGHRGLLTAWLGVERGRERAGTAGIAWDE